MKIIMGKATNANWGHLGYSGGSNSKGNNRGDGELKAGKLKGTQARDRPQTELERERGVPIQKQGLKERESRGRGCQEQVRLLLDNGMHLTRPRPEDVKQDRLEKKGRI